MFILFCLYPASLYPQENVENADSGNNEDIVHPEDSMPEPAFLHPDQDSLLNALTNLPGFMEKQNNQLGHFEDTLNHVLRYYQQTIPDIPSCFMDIIRNPVYEEMGYSMSFRDTMVVDPLFMPIVFDGKVLPDNMLFPQFTNPFGKDFLDILQLKDSDAFRRGVSDIELRKKAREYVAYYYPELIRYRKSDLPQVVEKAEPMQVNIFEDLFQVENNPDFEKESGPDKFDPGRKYWFFSGSSQLTVSQNYISDNWYNGGTGNLNITSDQIFRLRYEDDKYVFNNEFRWKLSMFSVPEEADSLRSTKIGEELVRNYSDFGIKAFGKWSYSTNLEVKTQFLNNYVANTTQKSSAFLAPLYINMGVVGMKYSLDKKLTGNKHKRITVSTDISPFSFQYVLITDSIADPGKFKIPEGKNHRTVYGSSINAIFNFIFNRNVSFNSRFKYFTTYRAVNMESENKLIMTINRYFSTNINLYVRFDDTDDVERDPRWGYFQVNELLSFGLNYTW